MHSCSIIPPWIICDTRLIWTLNLWDRGIKGYNLKVLSFIMLEQQSGNNSPKAKATRFYKVLLARTHACARMYCQHTVRMFNQQEQSSCDNHSSQIFKCLLSGPWEEKFANSYIRWPNSTTPVMPSQPSPKCH